MFYFYRGVLVNYVIMLMLGIVIQVGYGQFRNDEVQVNKNFFLDIIILYKDLENIIRVILMYIYVCGYFGLYIFCLFFEEYNCSF